MANGLTALTFGILIILIGSQLSLYYPAAFGQEALGPIVFDTELVVKPLVKGLYHPVSMAFVGPNDILILQDKIGHINRITNGTLLENPILDLHIGATEPSERCLCGIAVSKENDRVYVFIYYTESSANRDGDEFSDGGAPLGNRLYRYELVGNNLINRTLLLDLPAFPGPIHNGGAITIGPDENIYIPIGDVNGSLKGRVWTKAQNYADGIDPDGRAGILRITKDGGIVNGSVLGESFPLNLYFAYGIRNSFGIDFDLLTGKLWDTENGPMFGDEVNLVDAGFNSGWVRMQGIWEVIAGNELTWGGKGNVTWDPQDLEDFGGRGNYSSPEFTWEVPRGLTALKFFHSDRYGERHKDNLFVSDVNHGNIYEFSLNSNRTGFVLNGSLKDKVAEGPPDTGEDAPIIFARIPPNIVDLEVGPDGILYAVAISEGAIYRIVPYKDQTSVNTSNNITTVAENSTILYYGNDSSVALATALANVLPGQKLEIGEGTYSVKSPVALQIAQRPSNG